MKKLIRSSTRITGSSYGAQDYENFFTMFRGKQKYAVRTSFEQDPDSFQFQVSEIHPYDMAEYAWAKKWSPASVSIYRDGKEISNFPVPEYDEDIYSSPEEYENELLDITFVALQNANADVVPMIDRT